MDHTWQWFIANWASETPRNIDGTTTDVFQKAEGAIHQPGINFARVSFICYIHKIWFFHLDTRCLLELLYNKHLSVFQANVNYIYIKCVLSLIILSTKTFLFFVGNVSRRDHEGVGAGTGALTFEDSSRDDQDWRSLLNFVFLRTIFLFLFFPERLDLTKH